MFIVSQFQDTLGVHPRDHYGLDEDSRKWTGRAIEMEINKKYVNRVFPDLGYTLCLWSVLDSSEGVVTYGNGLIYHKVSFQLVVFKPVIDEILVGRVLRQDETGCYVSVGFFENLFVPRSQCPPITDYDENTKRLYWMPDGTAKTDGDPDTEAPNSLFIDEGDAIRVRVQGDRFDYAKAPGAKAAEGDAYMLECSIMGDGLGLLEWW